jgi:hypothetical protein
MASRTTAIASNQVAFPILVINRNFFYIFTDWDHFTTGRRSGLVRGWYSNLFVLDSANYGVSIIDAKKLHGIGFFWGWNLLGGQRIKLEYTFANDRRKYSMKEIRHRILNCFKDARVWRDLDNLDEFKRHVTRATSIDDLMQILRASPGSTCAINSEWW